VSFQVSLGGTLFPGGKTGRRRARKKFDFVLPVWCMLRQAGGEGSLTPRPALRNMTSRDPHYRAPLRRFARVMLTLFLLIVYLVEEPIGEPCLYCSEFCIAEATLRMDVAKS